MNDKERKLFIDNIAKYIQAECIARGYNYPSAIIAQACNESNFGASKLAKYYNFFGMKCGSKWKGASVNMTTKEEYKAGTLTTIKDNFRSYDSIVAGVRGYFDFISVSRYSNLKDAESPRDYIEKIKADGYATSTKYVDNVYKIVEQYNLTMYDITVNTESKKHTAIVNTVSDPLRLRAVPKGPIILLMPKGSKVELLEVGAQWCKVKYKNTVGYASTTYLKEV